MVDFVFISARFLGTDYADEVFAPPSEYHSINLCIDPAEGYKANFSAVFPVVDPLQNLVGKNFGSRQKRNAMFGEVGSGFFFIALELEFHALHRLLHMVHKCVHVGDSERNSSDRRRTLSPPVSRDQGADSGWEVIGRRPGGTGWVLRYSRDLGAHARRCRRCTGCL